MIIKLETNDGGLVGRFEIPPFKQAPDTMVWGDRVFIFIRAEGTVTKAEEVADSGYVYREVFAYAIVTPPLAE